MWQSMAVFLVPLMLSNLLQSASQTVNSIYIGRLLGVVDLAAISSIFPIVFLLISFLIGLASGSTVLIGQAFGAGKRERVVEIAGTTLSLSVSLGVVVAFTGWFFGAAMLRAIGTPPTVLPLAVDYARVLFVLLPILFVYLVYSTFLRGVGDTRTPFVVLIAGTVLNLILTPLFIEGWLGAPKLGLPGAAVATGLANALATAGMCVYLLRVRHPLAPDRMFLTHLVPHPKIIAAVVRLGIPTGLQLIMVSLSEIAVISFVNRYGADATASYGAVNQIVSYVQFPAISIGITCSIFGAQSIGAGRASRLGRIVRTGLLLNLVIGGVLIGLGYALSWALLGLFLTSEPTLVLAHSLLAITLWSYLVFGSASVLSATMRSSGDVIWPTLLSVGSIWGIEVPVAYSLSHRIGIDGIWIAYPVAFICLLILQTTYYRVFWKRRRIVALA
ncbi:MAG: MATE family efflux transporter [Vulcanimicrobiaceae bacterium]